MKKIIALILTGVMILAFAACADKGNKNEAGESTTAADEITSVKAEAEKADPAEVLFEDFKAIVKANPELTDEEIGTKLLENEIIPFMGATMAFPEGDLMGFKAPVTGFKSAAAFSPVIGTIPFMGYVFTLNDAADADAFIKTLKENANLRWNVCTEADEMKVEAVGDRVFFVMCPSTLEDDSEDMPMGEEFPMEDLPMEDVPAAEGEGIVA